MEVPHSLFSSVPADLVPFVIDMTHAFIMKMDESRQRNAYLIENISSIAFVMKWLIARMDGARCRQWFKLLPYDIIAATLPMSTLRDEGTSSAAIDALCRGDKFIRAIIDGRYDILTNISIDNCIEPSSDSLNFALAYRDRKALAIIVTAPTDISKYWYLRYISMAARFWIIPPNDETIMACVNYDMFADGEMDNGYARYEDAGRFVISTIENCSSRIINHCLLPPRGRRINVGKELTLRKRIVDWINKYGSGVTWKSATYLLSIGLPVDAGTMIQMIDGGYLAIVLTHSGTAHVNTYHDKSGLLNAAAKLPRNGRVIEAINACTPNIVGNVAINDVHRAYAMTGMGVGRGYPRDVSMICDDE